MKQKPCVQCAEFREANEGLSASLTAANLAKQQLEDAVNQIAKQKLPPALSVHWSERDHLTCIIDGLCKERLRNYISFADSMHSKNEIIQALTAQLKKLKPKANKRLTEDQPKPNKTPTKPAHQPRKPKEVKQ